MPIVKGLVLATLVCLFAAPAAAQELEPLSERERAAHALSRLAFGGRPGDLERVMEMGVEAWIEQQLFPADISDAPLRDRLGQYETLTMSTTELYEGYRMRIPADTPEDEKKRLREIQRTPRTQLSLGVVEMAVHSNRQLQMVLSEFWRNHFNVSFTKGRPVDLICADYEREVIQANVFGKFGTMLLQSAKHPAMLIYLDNVVSRRPASKAELNEIKAKARDRTGSAERAQEAFDQAFQRGLNENYARELFELHTLGVDNYYKQRDVEAVAEVLTGWTVDARGSSEYGFRYRPTMHVKGDKRVLGKVVREDRETKGYAEGVVVLDMLSEHRGTAEYICMKLVRYLVHDEPPAKLVDDAAETFKKTDGDLRAVVRTIVDSDEFWSRANYRAKFKTPFEFVTSAIRVTGAEMDDASQLVRALRGMGQPVYACDPPTGYGDTSESWLDPGVMALRWQFATDLAEGRVRGIRIPDSFYDDIPADVPARLWQHHLTKGVLAGGAGERTRMALSTITSEYLDRKKRGVPDIHELGPMLVGLLLGSPEFQQQ